MLTRDLQGETVWRDIDAWLADPRAPLPSGADGPAPTRPALAPVRRPAPSPRPRAPQPGGEQAELTDEKIAVGYEFSPTACAASTFDYVSLLQVA